VPELLDHTRAALAGHYDVLREIGSGGMAVVYLAHDTKHNRDVAIKVLRPEVATHLGGDRFLREIQIEARLQHPNILPLHDSGDAGGLPYYVMPYVEGESLRDRLVRERQLSLPDALGIASEVADALDYAHSQGVIHRDIKPENILLSQGHALVADFGIARAVSVAGPVSTTSSGIVVGTPTYMSPEQGDQTGAVDGRSDLYSLGCVVYEMLAGEPPFTGATAYAIMARQLGERPRSLRVVRHQVPPHVELAVERALEKVPADRFDTTREFVRALTAPAPRIQRRTRRRLIGGALLAVATLVTLLTQLGGTTLDASRYVLATLAGADTGRDSLRQRIWVYELEDALSRVPNITLQGSTSVNDRVLRAGAVTLDLADWFDISRDLGAGRALGYRAVALGDSIEVVLDVFDVSRKESIRSQRARISRSATDVRAQMARLVERLFQLQPRAILSGTTVPEANQAYAAARNAVARWELPLAASRFQEAIQLDPEYAEAYLWLAKVRSWADEPIEAWVGAARNAVARIATLPDEHSRGEARALLAMAERQFPQACVEYERLIALNSVSFEAWYGLGECRRRDGVVVRDPASPSRWRFRSSYHAAVLAYRRALDMVPSFNFAVARRLPEVLYAETAMIRAGRPEAPDTGRFYAYPSYDGDTLGFLPFPAADVLAGRSGAVPATLGRAVDGNRISLLTIVRSWAAAFPDSTQALRELARVLELTGQLSGGGRPEQSAMVAAERAEQVARTALDSAKAQVLAVRVRLKLGQYSEAAGIADSALLRWPAPEPALAMQLDGLAALLGRARQTARLATGAVPQLLADDFEGLFRGAPLSLLQVWKALDGYAALGVPIDSLRALSDRLDTSLASVGTSVQAAQWDCTLRWNTLGLAFFELRRAPDSSTCWSRSPYLEMQAALARGDLASVRERSAALRAARPATIPAGDKAAQGALHEALVVLEAGDTLAAVQHLDALLTALPSLRTDLLDEPAQAAGLVRVMALRAELAGSRGDRNTAGRWARAVATLWRQADPELQPIVARMTALLRG
jgi:serine/threonine protein kinase/tetratricopeptide (TPR) repeat protein